MTFTLAEKVANFCQQNRLLNRQDTLVIGVSGGPDSLGLLHLLRTLAPEFDLTLTVAHFNHQLRGASARADEAFVRDIATTWGLPFFVETQNITAAAAARRQSLEETARQVRYAFLWRVAEEVKANKIAVGHNADDQVETVLMHFLRGSGLAGLRGMLPSIDISSLRLHQADLPATPTQPAPRLIRPLLETPRADIETYCQIHHLSPRQDDSNRNTTFFRNRLRHELIPQLETYNPNIRQVLRRTANVVAAEVDFLNEYVDQAWQHVIKDITTDVQGDVDRVEINLARWLNFPLALKRATLRRAVQILRRSLRNIDFEHIDAAIAVVEKGHTGAQATLPRGLMLTISYDSLTIADRHADRRITAYPDHADIPRLLTGEILPLNLPGTTQLPHANWQLTANLLTIDQVDRQQVRQVEPWEAYLDADVVGKQPVLRPRQPGDTFCPLGLGGHRKKINEFMINAKIPAAQRDYLPLLVANGQILWVCGYRPDERACLQAKTRCVVHLKYARSEKT
ncbi:MAG: tRNA lysidine(34) synthetase TilS [Anaerolineae bacterium]|nr:tRNA lysidine(34) synthetase TilS [Anaerolineae bacterium]